MIIHKIKQDKQVECYAIMSGIVQANDRQPKKVFLVKGEYATSIPDLIGHGFELKWIDPEYGFLEKRETLSNEYVWIEEEDVFIPNDDNESNLAFMNRGDWCE